MNRQRWISGTMVLSLLAALILAAPRQPAAAQTNLIFNPGFEDAGNSITGNGWNQWWQETPRPSDGSLNYAYKPSWNVEKKSAGAATELIYAGNNSQRVINNWDPWYAGVYQTVNAPAGSKVRLTAYARLWTSNSNWPAASDTGVGATVQVGLEPSGGTSALASSVIWSATTAPHNGWQTASVEAIVGSGGRVSVFLGASYRGYSRFYMAVFFDEASLVVTEGNPPTATNTPPGAATATNTPAPGTPSSTPGPTATPTLWPITGPTVTALPAGQYVVKRGDTVTKISRLYHIPAWMIINANNIKDIHKIYVGQVLIIPAGAVTPVAGTFIYTIVRGDTLSQIAKRYGTTVARLRELNVLRKDNLIFPGQRIVVGR
ncbi:MAG: LysM peptidoglycan-binding domain-containing protein [Anaerolineales bacterium]